MLTCPHLCKKIKSFPNNPLQPLRYLHHSHRIHPAVPEKIFPNLCNFLLIGFILYVLIGRHGKTAIRYGKIVIPHVRHKRRINNQEMKKNKLYDLYIDYDYFSRDDLKRKLIELDRSISSLKSHFKSLQIDQERLQVEVNNVIETFRKLPEMYGKADNDKKSRILKEMAERVIIDKGNAGIQWRKPYIFFMKDEVLSMKDRSQIKQELQKKEIHAGSAKSTCKNKTDATGSSITSVGAPAAGRFTN